MKEKSIINPRPPTERDLKILEFMNSGNRIDSAKALGLFKTTGLRDALYRLRCAGNVIFHEDVSYLASDGKRKSYRQWFTKPFEILETGYKTDKERLNAAKGHSNIHKNTAEIKENVIQGSIF